MKNKFSLILITLLIISITINYYLYKQMLSYTVNNDKQEIFSDEINNSSGSTNIGESLRYQEMEKAFEDIKSIEEFNKFYDLPGTSIYFLSLKKMGDKHNWDKFIKFLSEKEHIDLKKQGDIIYNLTDNTKIDLSKKPINDFYFITSGNKISELIEYCKKYFTTKESVQSCQNNIYFYRATKENNYCNKIDDPMKVNICKDFITHYIN